MAQPAAGPEPNTETRPFFDAANEGRLLIRRCLSCTEPHFYPRPICPFCFSADTAWEQASGFGTVYACSVQRRAETPYCIAYVTLDEGPTMLSNVVGCDPGAVRIGDRVQVGFRRSESGQAVPVFTPP